MGVTLPSSHVKPSPPSIAQPQPVPGEMMQQVMSESMAAVFAVPTDSSAASLVSSVFLVLSWMALTLSIVSSLWSQVGRITEYGSGYNYGLDKTRFTAPVRAGARIRLRATMLPPQHRRGGTIVGIHCVVEVEGEERPASAERRRQCW